MPIYRVKSPRSWYYVSIQEFERLCKLLNKDSIWIPALNEFLLTVPSASLINKSCVL